MAFQSYFLLLKKLVKISRVTNFPDYGGVQQYLLNFPVDILGSVT